MTTSAYGAGTAERLLPATARLQSAEIFQFCWSAMTTTMIEVMTFIAVRSVILLGEEDIASYARLP